MKPRIISFILAAILILSCCTLAACSDSDEKPGDTGSGTSGSGDTTTAPDSGDNTPGEEDNGLPSEYFSGYTPDANAAYQGKVGLSGTGVSFDGFRVSDGTATIYKNTFDESDELPESIFSVYGGALSDWAVVDDAKKEGNKKLAYGGSDSSVITFGNDQWTKYRLQTDILLEDGGVAEIYFCVKDENNYYKFTVGASAEVGMILSETVSGSETVLRKVGASSDTGSWLSVTVKVSSDSIDISVDDLQIFTVGDSAYSVAIDGKILFSQWQTEVMYDDITIEDLTTGEIIYSENFDDGTFLDDAEYGIRNGGSWAASDNSNGEWEITDSPDGEGKVLHFTTASSALYGATVVKDAGIPAGTEAMKITAKLYRVSGVSADSEGWAVGWNWTSAADYLCVNLGGWSGRVAFQTIAGGVKTNEPSNPADAGIAPIGLADGQWMTVEIYVYPDIVYTVFNGNLILTHVF